MKVVRGSLQPTQLSGEIISEDEVEPVEADPVPAEADPVAEEAVSVAAEQTAVTSDREGQQLVSTQTVQHDYLTLNGKVARETITVDGTVTTVMDFIYDESGRPFALKYSTDGGSSFTTYYYVLNLQGDVVHLIDPNGNSYAEYSYDAWGNITFLDGELAEINPLRYRGYYYDTETGFYYLQSRYYDPANRRFINADVYTSTDVTDAIGCNMFAYCGNNPVINMDPTGEILIEIALIWFVESLFDDNDDQSENDDGCVIAIGQNFSATGRNVNIAAQYGIALDDKGNVLVYRTDAIGTSTGTTGASSTTAISFCDAPSVDALLGSAFSTGNSVGFPIYNVPASVGYDYTPLPQADGEMYGIYTFGTGVGTPGYEQHYMATNTKAIAQFNIFDWFLSLFK